MNNHTLRFIYYQQITIFINNIKWYFFCLNSILYRVRNSKLDFITDFKFILFVL